MRIPNLKYFYNGGTSGYDGNLFLFTHFKYNALYTIMNLILGTLCVIYQIPQSDHSKEIQVLMTKIKF